MWVNIPLFIGFYTYIQVVVWDFWTINSRCRWICFSKFWFGMFGWLVWMLLYKGAAGYLISPWLGPFEDGFPINNGDFTFGMLQKSIKNWMGPNPNGPRSVSCDRAILRFFRGPETVGPFVGDFWEKGADEQMMSFHSLVLCWQGQTYMEKKHTLGGSDEIYNARFWNKSWMIPVW